MRKTLNLPSGATIIVRSCSQMDFIGLGALPMVVAPPAEVVDPDAPPPSPTKEDIERGAKLLRIILTRCTGIFTHGVRRQKLVDKPLSDLRADEMCLEELSDADAMMIIDEVKALSGMTKEVAADAATFPGKPEAVPDARPDGAAVPLPAK